MKRAFIVHGWGGSPREGWFPWLKNELTHKGFSVFLLSMPRPKKPLITDWVSHLAKSVKNSDSETYFVGHSIGCQTILRYLEKVDTLVGGAVLVAPWLTLTGLETKEDKETAKSWLETPIDFVHVKKIATIHALFSDNDPFVSMENVRLFKQKLAAVTMIEHHKGHFTGDDDVILLHSVITALNELTG